MCRLDIRLPDSLSSCSPSGVIVLWMSSAWMIMLRMSSPGVMVGSTSAGLTTAYTAEKV